MDLPNPNHKSNRNPKPHPNSNPKSNPNPNLNPKPNSNPNSNPTKNSGSFFSEKNKQTLNTPKLTEWTSCDSLRQSGRMKNL